MLKWYRSIYLGTNWPPELKLEINKTHVAGHLVRPVAGNRSDVQTARPHPQEGRP